jgi:hypothetical protein
VAAGARRLRGTYGGCVVGQDGQHGCPTNGAALAAAPSHDSTPDGIQNGVAAAQAVTVRRLMSD